MINFYTPNLNYEILIKNTERLEALLNTYKGDDVFLRVLYEILEGLFEIIYAKQLKEKTNELSLDAVLGCAGHQINDSGLDVRYPDLGPLYSDFYWEVQGLGNDSDRKPGLFYKNSKTIRV